MTIGADRLKDSGSKFRGEITRALDDFIRSVLPENAESGEETWDLPCDTTDERPSDVTDLGKCCDSFSDHIDSDGKWTTVRSNLNVHYNLKEVIQWVLRNPTWCQQDSKVGARSIVTCNFYCKLNGNIKKTLRRHQIREGESNQTGLPTKGLSKTASGGFNPCPVKMRIHYYAVSTGGGHLRDIQVKGMHNHEKLQYAFFRPRMIALDPSLRLYNLICKTALENVSFDGTRIIQHVTSLLMGSPRFRDTMEFYGNIVARLRNEFHSEVSSLARCLRGYNIPLSLGYLTRKFEDQKERYLGASEFERKNQIRIMDIYHEMSPQSGLSEFSCLISCDSMLSRAYSGFNNVLFVDATYRMSTSDIPLIIFGVESSRRQFFPVAFTLSLKETSHSYSVIFNQLKRCVERNLDSEGFSRSFWCPSFVQADGCAAITRGMKATFIESDESSEHLWNISASIDVQRLNCFFHVMQNVRKKLHEMGVIREARDIIKSFQILCNARSKTQLRSWVQHFRDRYVDCGDNVQRFFDYLTGANGYLNLDSWQSSWTWVPVDLSTENLDILWTSRTNNPLERFNRTLKNICLGRRLPSLHALLDALTGDPLAATAFNDEGGITHQQDYESYVSLWSSANKFSNWKYHLVQNFQFLNGKESDGDSCIIGRSLPAASVLDQFLSGDYNPFCASALEKLCICYIPRCSLDNEAEIWSAINRSPSLNGPMCTCLHYVRQNRCAHICWMFRVLRRLRPPSATLIIAPRIQSRGPIEVPMFGGRHTLAPLRFHQRQDNVEVIHGSSPGDQEEVGESSRPSRRRRGRPRIRFQPPVVLGELRQRQRDIGQGQEPETTHNDEVGEPHELRVSPAPTRREMNSSGDFRPPPEDVLVSHQEGSSSNTRPDYIITERSAGNMRLRSHPRRSCRVVDESIRTIRL